MNLYLVSGLITKSLYEGEDTEFTSTKIVYADNESEAENKFNAYWLNKTSEYSVYYSARNINANEAIQ